MLTFILVLLGYVMIAGITAAILVLICDEEDIGWAFLSGLFWPIAIPVYILLCAICLVVWLVVWLVAYLLTC